MIFHLKIFCPIVFISCFTLAARAQVFEEGSWTDFNGSIGNKRCQASLYLFKDSTVKGNYVYKSDSVKQRVSGYLHGNILLLTDSVNKKIAFKGMVSTPPDELQGTLTDSSTGQTKMFGLYSISSNSGDYGNRYADLGGTEDEVETFVRTAKRAILTGDKQWLATHIQHPVLRVLPKGYPIVKNAALFIKYFDQIFTPKFKAKIKEDYTTNLFTKNGAVMLGDGEIWVSGTERSKDFVIIAINK